MVSALTTSSLFALAATALAAPRLDARVPQDQLQPAVQFAPAPTTTAAPSDPFSFPPNDPATQTTDPFAWPPPEPTPDQAEIDASWNKATCYSSNNAGMFRSWMILIPKYNDYSPETIKDNFYGSISDSSACRGASAVIGWPKWKEVGKMGTVAVMLNTGMFCTNYQMTKVIKDTTGNLQNTPCNDWSGQGSPMVLLPPGLKKREDPSGPSDQEIARLLGVPENTPKEELIKMLDGPSALDNQ